MQIQISNTLKSGLDRLRISSNINRVQTEENILPALQWLTLSCGRRCEAWCWHPNRIGEQSQAVAAAPDSSAPRNKYPPEHNDPKRKHIIYCVRIESRAKRNETQNRECFIGSYRHSCMPPCASRVELKRT